MKKTLTTLLAAGALNAGAAPIYSISNPTITPVNATTDSLSYVVSNISDVNISDNNLSEFYIAADNVVPGSASGGAPGWNNELFYNLDFDNDGDFEDGIRYFSPFSFANIPVGDGASINFQVSDTPNISYETRDVAYTPEAEGQVQGLYIGAKSIPEPSSGILTLIGLFALSKRRARFTFNLYAQH